MQKRHKLGKQLSTGIISSRRTALRGTGVYKEISSSNLVRTTPGLRVRHFCQANLVRFLYGLIARGLRSHRLLARKTNSDFFGQHLLLRSSGIDIGGMFLLSICPIPFERQLGLSGESVKLLATGCDGDVWPKKCREECTFAVILLQSSCCFGQSRFLPFCRGGSAPGGGLLELREEAHKKRALLGAPALPPKWSEVQWGMSVGVGVRN